MHDITKTCTVYPLEPHFYIAKLGYTGVYLFFLFLLQNIDCGYLLEPPCLPTIYILSKNKKYIKNSTKNFHFLQLKKSLYVARPRFRNGGSTVGLLLLQHHNGGCY